jgi:hypothetical protein
MYQPLSLEELKIEAQKQNHLVIRRDGETAWRPLKNWKGHPTSTAVYYLIEDRVVVKVGLENNAHCYTLS